MESDGTITKPKGKRQKEKERQREGEGKKENKLFSRQKENK